MLGDASTIDRVMRTLRCRASHGDQKRNREAQMTQNERTHDDERERRARMEEIRVTIFSQ